MKLLFPFIFLLSFACHGQRTSISMWFLVDSGITTGKANVFWNPVTGFGAGDTTLKENQFIFGAQKGRYWSGTVWPEPSLELLQYAKECYNDSTRYCYYTLCDIECWDASCECGTSVPGFIDIPCLEKYIHRKPTFEGFIEWLRKNKQP